MSTTSPANPPHDAAADVSAANLAAAHLAGLATLERHLASLGALDVSSIAGCGGEVMLVVEGTDLTGQVATWVITAAPGRPMMLEAMVDESRLDLIAIAPADRILTLVAALARRVRVDA